MRKFYLIFGSIAALGLASAAACTSDSTGDGGSGGTATGTTSTGGTTSMGGGGTGGTGGAGTGGGDACAGCGDYVTDPAVAVEDLCGFVSIDEMTNELTCDADSSCAALGALQLCTCAMDGCATECGDNACAGDAESTECLMCVTSTCLDEFNTCSGDVAP